MKDELTELMHSEFTVSEEIDRKNRVGSAIQFAMIGNGGEENLMYALKLYALTYKDYETWKDYWAEVGVKI